MTYEQLLFSLPLLDKLKELLVIPANIPFNGDVLGLMVKV